MSTSESTTNVRPSMLKRILHGSKLVIILSPNDLLFFSVVFGGLFCLVIRSEPGIGSFGLLQAIIFYYFFESGGKGMRRPLKWAYCLFSLCILVILTIASWHSR